MHHKHQCGCLQWQPPGILFTNCHHISTTKEKACCNHRQWHQKWLSAKHWIYLSHSLTHIHTPLWNNDVAINQVHVAKHWIIDCVKQVIYYCTPRSGSTGEYSVLSFCIGPPYGRANTASLEPNILLYCPPTRAITCMYFPSAMMLIRMCISIIVQFVASDCPSILLATNHFYPRMFCIL